MDRNAKDAQILEQYNSQYKGLAAKLGHIGFIWGGSVQSQWTSTTAIAWPFGKKTPTRGGAARLGWRSGRSPPGGNILLRWPQGENWKRAAQCERLVPVRRPIL